jgi:hypothetical protein
LDSALLQLLLPEGLTDYFKLEKVDKASDSIRLYLSEKNIHPIGFTGQKLTSKRNAARGFLMRLKLEISPCGENLAF